MSAPASRPGAAPVGALAGLPPLAGLSVLALRLWCERGDRALALDLVAALGPERGAVAAAAFGSLCRLCIESGRRPLMRHGAACPCLGADEAAFAELVTQAAEGEAEDALMLACCLVRADLAPALVGHARSAGLQLLRALAAPAATRH